jgi:ribosomal protein S18 acetylase RimI-like enzyme
VPTDADAAAAGLVGTLQLLASANPDGWTSSGPGVTAAVSGVALPTLNGVWIESTDADERTVAELLDQVAATGLPHCLQVRPGASARLADVATARGMSQEDHLTPLMVLAGPDRLSAAQGTGGLEIRELAPAAAAAHAELAAAGFEAPVELFLQMMTPSTLALPGVRCYLGEVDGNPVSTGLGVVIDASVGIFNIATPPESRRRGYGAALTSRIVEDAFSAGATSAWLQSSTEGFSIYKRLGFRDVEQWTCWISPETGAP